MIRTPGGTRATMRIARRERGSRGARHSNKQLLRSRRGATRIEERMGGPGFATTMGWTGLPIRSANNHLRRPAEMHNGRYQPDSAATNSATRQSSHLYRAKQSK